MVNPFQKRATEYLRDEAAFLSVVTPEPLDVFFKKHAITEALFDRLCMIIGNPGSGKTTIARLLEFSTVHTLVHSPNHTEYRPLEKALTDCKIISHGDIQVIACRIPMESEYREFWELPYEKEVKLGLLKSFLQARAVILWLQGLRDVAGFDLKRVELKYREGAYVASESLGGNDAEKILKQAIIVEREIYRISAALVPPPIQNLPESTTSPYHPFDALETIVVKMGLVPRVYRPLVILDDVHSLHSDQIFLIQDWLAKREMKISRWLMMRLDAQTPENILGGITFNVAIDNAPTIKKSREITEIWLQNRNEDRRTHRQNFRTMAKNMADKYLGLMPVFNRQGIKSFQNILSTDIGDMSDSKCKDLREKIEALQRRVGIDQVKIDKYEKEIEKYVKGSTSIGLNKDVKLAMLLILLNRYIVRAPQTSLFDTETTIEPTKQIKPNSGVVDGARIYLMHKYGRPYYYGIDAVCNGSSENAEQFLQLAGQLVSASEKRIIQGKSSILPADYQHKLLIEKANNVVEDWNFPMHIEVIKLCKRMAIQCVEKSLEPNASLDGGANAFGIPEEQFSKVATEHPELAQILKFGVAYGAISIKRHHKTKYRYWALVELTGPYLITQRLTLIRGGFLERAIGDLIAPIERLR